MSAGKPRKPGQPVYRKPESGLRLVKSPDARPAPTPDPELKAVLDDMKRHYRVQREPLDRGSDDRMRRDGRDGREGRRGEVTFLYEVGRL